MRLRPAPFAIALALALLALPPAPSAQQAGAAGAASPLPPTTPIQDLKSRAGKWEGRVTTRMGVSEAFATMGQETVGAVVVLIDPVLLLTDLTIVRLAAQHRLPLIAESRQYVTAGGLMSYGPSYADLARRAARYVDRILKGARPADLPVEQPTTFELVVNARAAKALGLTIPPSLLLRADRVIE